ncbi:hypothetical protein R3P38DRAFT_2787941 [Favolaschia claudopus]|uniref:Uncharacterized protein n=1 Tax=Favolaschia claudopus TaxID=2862362 RepID=A0AAW0AL52_9AGAR
MTPFTSLYTFTILLSFAAGALGVYSGGLVYDKAWKASRAYARQGSVFAKEGQASRAPHLSLRTLTAGLFQFQWYSHCPHCDESSTTCDFGKATVALGATATTGNSYTTTFTIGSTESDVLTKGQHCDSKGDICFSATTTTIKPAPAGNVCVYYANDKVCFDFTGEAVDGSNKCGYTIAAEIPNSE